VSGAQQRMIRLVSGGGDREEAGARRQEAPRPDAARPMIELSGAGKSYGKFAALRPIDLTIDEGEFVSVVGPSGCGKSTLLKLVAGLSPASSGEVRLQGQRVDAPQTGIGIVFQSPVLLAWRTILKNILLQAEMRGLPRAPARARALELMRMAGLEGFEDRYPWQLSGGMQQRASICRALLHDPGVILMDEPFGALDAMTRETMNAELQRIWMQSRKTVLLITHSIPEAVFLSDRLVVMSERPGGIEAEYRIDLPRPRDLGVMTTPEFGAYARLIRRHFGGGGAVDH